MRRLSILLIGVLAFSNVALGSGVASASTDSKTSTASCAALVKMFATSEPATKQDPKSLGRVFKRASKAFTRGAKTAPAALKGSFKRLAKAYARLGRVDFTDPASASKLSAFPQSVAKDLAKIGTYLTTNCMPK